MVINKRQLIINALLIIAAAYTGWLIMRYAIRQPVIHYSNPESPDAFAQNITAIRMDENGKILNQLYSPYMEHFEDNNKTTLQSPHFVIYPENKQPWNIYANNGAALEGITTILLWGNVKIHQAYGPNNPQTDLATEKLTLSPEQKIAQTDQPVTMTQPGSRVQSIGMKVDLKQSSVELLSNVQGQYTPDAN